MTIGERIKTVRETKKISQIDLANAVSISKQTLYKYENGIVTNIPSDKIEAIAAYLCVSPAYLMGWQSADAEVDISKIDNILPLPKMRRIPLLGDIACGEPILAVENLDGNVEIPDNIDADFALRCKGDSMINARIFNGDIVYIRQQPTVENGEIAAVLIDNDATLKRVHLYGDHISLEAENPQYRPLVYWGEDMNAVKILGKAVAFTSAIR